MSDPTLKELRERKKKVERGMAIMLKKFQDKFGVEVESISIDHKHSASNSSSPYGTEVSIIVRPA